MKNRTILVLGGTGLMGREVLGALRRRGAAARVLVRDPAKLRSQDGLDVRIGDLRDPASVRAAIAGVNVVFAISPHEADEVTLTRTVIDACEREGARLVYAGIHLPSPNPLAGWITRHLYGLLMPRYRGKFAIGRLVERSATDPVILAPSNFMQNDEVLLASIEEGSFVHPLSGKGVNRVNLRDLGEIAATALLDPYFPSGRYPVVGPRSLTGPECAAIWAEALGRPVRYVGDDDAALEAAIDRQVTGYRREDWRASLKVLRTHAVATSAEELAVTEGLLGRKATDFTEFVRRVVAERAIAAGQA
ncbi:MAG: NAD(P)H-binding protein [Micropruina sp.]